MSEDLEPSILFCGQMHGCAGQNKNHTMVGFLARKGDFCSVNHKFLVQGHTYLPNDRDFTQVEKQKAVAQVHLPQDWTFKKQKKQPFTVSLLTHGAFYDYKTFASTNIFQLKKTTAKYSEVQTDSVV